VRSRERLGWTSLGAVARTHALGASLAIAAPCDQLFLATEINEWALCASLLEREPQRWRGLQDSLAAAALADAPDPDTFIAPVLAEAGAALRFQRLAEREARPGLIRLLAAAAGRALPHVLDESELTLGAGTGARSFPLAALPEPGSVPWAQLHDVPTALVTGSNGKTTTVRVLAACARAQGWRTGFNCTDGVFLDAEVLASGDYAGPAGARRVMREPRVQAAILESARGGILRRGIAVSHAHVAIVTNVSSDHLGEYGVHDLETLAEVKLTVASVLSPTDLLVVNADDALVRAKVPLLARRYGFCPPLGWFALAADHPVLRQSRAQGAPTCGARAGRLMLHHGGIEHELGPVAAMPLSVGGIAGYNVLNLAAAALAAARLGIAPARIAGVLARFGAAPADNPGRLVRIDIGGVRVLVDFAHNPDSLRGILGVASQLRGPEGRLAMLLGHAGNRLDSDLEEVAHVAAQFRPDLVVVKEIATHLRGRELGEVPRIIRAALLRHGLAESAVPVRESELEAARCALDWARPGDVIAMLVHSPAGRAAVLELLAHQQAAGRSPPPATAAS
jgi:cyanophycin synthetase